MSVASSLKTLYAEAVEHVRHASDCPSVSEGAGDEGCTCGAVAFLARFEAAANPLPDVCAFCKHFDIGRAQCRRYPPTPAPWPMGNQTPVVYEPYPTWPSMSADDWCGEFSRRAL